MYPPFTNQDKIRIARKVLDDALMGVPFPEESWTLKQRFAVWLIELAARATFKALNWAEDVF